ncbi:dipeptide ABC transporter ATP-binding protein [Paenibacillus sp. J5C_2022]|uniref:ABC transporter ATP-binding protein n=1 Tax=Paenibacillus sp. J5C2022 TaxID=2977129 RepID=UPI0021D274FB|nr:dipeptide ABC transporter ATP-binding protein [Paenibacillus sp. J5C2022]MCU6710121.1 dipeptide ABC transporter ATP-binding protein [Paenibacillus sp. J5C2022]
MPTRDPLIEVRGLTKRYPSGSGKWGASQHVHAVNDVSFRIYPGETLGLVGESGCGKSTTGGMLANLIAPSAGEIVYNGMSIHKQARKSAQQLRKEIGVVFQDPYSSLNPRHRIGSILQEPLRIHREGSAEERLRAAREMLEFVGLDDSYAARYPNELSGGQRQRIGIARALMLKPRFIVADEPVSALDVSVQAQIVNLLQDMQKRFSLTTLFVSHDMNVVQLISDRIAVMYLGRIVEIAPAAELFRQPLHPYTQALLSAIPADMPSQKRERIVLDGEVPSPIHPPSGCAFHTRCRHATAGCKEQAPALREAGEGRLVSCFLT